MTPFDSYISANEAFIFGFDNVLYPKKDYDLQVYYLFAELMEYTELLPAKPMMSYMQEQYEIEGTEGMFGKVAARFGIPAKYAENFQRLHQTARLPLKLLLYKQSLAFLQEIIVNRKPVFLLLEGDPRVQLNKIRQTEWNGLEKYLTLYFTEEIKATADVNGIDYILSKYNFLKNKVLYTGRLEEEEMRAKQANIKFLQVAQLT